MQRRRRQPRRSRSDASARNRGRHVRLRGASPRSRTPMQAPRSSRAVAVRRAIGFGRSSEHQRSKRASPSSVRRASSASRSARRRASCSISSSLPSAGNTTYRSALRSAALGDSSRSSTPHPQPNPPRARSSRRNAFHDTPAASVAGPRRPQGRLHSLPRGGGIVPAAPLDSALLGITRAPMSSSAAWKVPPSRKA